MNEKLIGHGFIPSLITDDQYIFGAQKLPTLSLQDNRDWTAYLPEGEWQARRNWDTYGCSVYNTLNPLEILERRLYGKSTDYSERFVYIGTDTRPPGNNPHIIAEWIRKNGLIPETRLPFDQSINSLEEYRRPNIMYSFLKEEGEEWQTKNDFLHEWVFKGGTIREKHERIKEALRYSPLGVSVVGWKEQSGVYCKEEGEADNHWTCLVAYDTHPWVFDSYPPFIKKLDSNYDFGFCKKYSIGVKTASPKKWHSFFGSYFSDLLR